MLREIKPHVYTADVEDFRSFSTPGRLIDQLGDLEDSYSFVVPDGVRNLSMSIFSIYDLKAIAIPPSVTFMSSDGYSFQGLEGVYIKDLAAWCMIDFNDGSSNLIGNHGVHFYVGNKEINDTLIIPGGVTVIRPYTFDGFRVKHLELPDTVSIIGPKAFYNTDLEEVIIPASVTAIGRQAFTNYALKKMTVLSDDIKLVKESIPYGLEILRIKKSVYNKNKAYMPPESRALKIEFI